MQDTLGGGKEETGSSGHSSKPGPWLLKVVVTLLQTAGILHWGLGCPGKCKRRAPEPLPRLPGKFCALYNQALGDEEFSVQKRDELKFQH